MAHLIRRRGHHLDGPEAQLRAETGLLPEVQPVGRGTILSRIWSQPSITVTGIDAPTVAIFCEYDALEEIGHACGHNVIAAAGKVASMWGSFSGPS